MATVAHAFAPNPARINTPTLAGELSTILNDDEPCYPDDDRCAIWGCDSEPAGWAIIYREAA